MKSLGDFSQDWSYVFTMSTPRGKELNQYKVKLLKGLFEVCVSEDNNAIFNFVGTRLRRVCVINFFIGNDNNIALGEG